MNIYFFLTKSEVDKEVENDANRESETFEDSEYDMGSKASDDVNVEEQVGQDVCGDKNMLESEDDYPSGKDSDVQLYDPTFELGIIFSNKSEFKVAVHLYIIKNKMNIKITKNDKIRVHAKCADNECGWKIHTPKLKNESTFQIREYFQVTNLCGKYVQKFKSDPKRNVKGFRVDVMGDIRCNITHYQVYKAKRLALEMLEGNSAKQYSLLWDYANEIKRTNPSSTIIIETAHNSGEDRLDRIYVCLHDYEWTFMFNKQKGLTQAFQEVFLNYEHRFCVRHMHCNFKNYGFIGQAYKFAVWKVAKATTINEFKRMMSELRALDEKATEWFNDKPPQQWSRSHFSCNPRFEMLLNNVCETFNSNILEAREKPIISMLEWIMEYLMKRMQENINKAKKKNREVFCVQESKR
ncbi:hypothetical protein Pfo_006903 [Paulownia fortunei]|nr:hypothetical protein Pfo_006903 [Paulownia fortunei]